MPGITYKLLCNRKCQLLEDFGPHIKDYFTGATVQNSKMVDNE